MGSNPGLAIPQHFYLSYFEPGCMLFAARQLPYHRTGTMEGHGQSIRTPAAAAKRALLPWPRLQRWWRCLPLRMNLMSCMSKQHASPHAFAVLPAELSSAGVRRTCGRPGAGRHAAPAAHAVLLALQRLAVVEVVAFPAHALTGCQSRCQHFLFRQSSRTCVHGGQSRSAHSAVKSDHYV